MYIGPEEVSLLEKCSNFRGCYGYSYMYEDVSLECYH